MVLWVRIEHPLVYILSLMLGLGCHLVAVAGVTVSWHRWLPEAQGGSGVSGIYCKRLLLGEQMVPERSQPLCLGPTEPAWPAWPGQERDLR